MAFIKGTKSFYQYELSDQVAHNTRSWLDYSLLQFGAFSNVQFSNIGTSGYTNLKQSDQYTFEGLGPSWVWENDIKTIDSSTAPLVSSGIYINSVFYKPSTSGSYPYYINFREGQVVFSTPQSGISVQCEYSFRDIDVYLSDSPQWKRLVTNYLTEYDNFSTNNPSGLNEILKLNRIWLPAVIIETQDNNNTALQLGGGDYANINVLYHIFSDKPFSNKRLCDLINNQKETTLILYDINSAPFPYNRNGSLGSGNMTYYQLASGNSPYYWTNGYISESQGGPRDDIFNIYRGEIRQQMKIQRDIFTY